jgi:regulator of sirC expression with transglutaminase-like and TPR domain
MDSNNIKAMISLLDDSDQEVFSHISNDLVSMGKEVVPLLEDAWSHSFDPVVQSRIENIVHRIQFTTLKDQLSVWAASASHDLLAGSLLVARYQYPDLEEDKVRSTINGIRKAAWLELQDHMEPEEQVLILNKILFEINGFNGNTANFHAPQNSFINTVLESKKGNPLLLCIIYSLIAQQLDLPIYGVNLPEHFVLAYQDNKGITHHRYTYPEAGILFYINAFSKGSIFNRSDIDQFLKKLNIEQNHTFYEPCSNVDMIRRMLRNIAFSFDKLGQTDKAAEIEELIECLEIKGRSF